MRFLLSLLLLLPLGARAALSDALERYRQQRARETVELTHQRHASRLRHHGAKTKYAVLYLHGLFESPHYNSGILETFHAAGMNVYAPLLAGHWRRDRRQSFELSHADWLRDLRDALELTRKLGDKILVAGFSTGGLLALRAALEHDDVAGLLLWAPALHLTQLTYWSVRYGQATGLTLNDRLRLPADGFDVADYSPKLGHEVIELIRDTFRTHGAGLSAAARRRSVGKKLNLPLFLVMSDVDDTADPRALDEFFTSYAGPKERIRYRAADDILHGNITKAPQDVFVGWEDRFNFQFEEKRARILNFLERLP